MTSSTDPSARIKVRFVDGRSEYQARILVSEFRHMSVYRRTFEVLPIERA